ncbi:hypothetical protein BpHYR1_017819 [Brachionus plicatilis]|uniref:Uncharacterized protein n=1 Tax=Brachionus plicatilis TaxID=10195 RepID=A0A3M7RM63_BRAPC|nr:hypothetical protein BpHYR1_017819 [Brachionus plicatilis]
MVYNYLFVKIHIYGIHEFRQEKFFQGSSEWQRLLFSPHGCNWKIFDGSQDSIFHFLLVPSFKFKSSNKFREIPRQIIQFEEEKIIKKKKIDIMFAIIIPPIYVTLIWAHLEYLYLAIKIKIKISKMNIINFQINAKHL